MKRFWAVLLTLAICLAALPSLAATTKALDAAPLAADTAAHDGTIRVWLSTLAGQSYTVTIAGDYTIDGDTSRQIKDGSKITVSFSGGAVYLNQGGSSQSMGSGFTLRRHAGGSGYNAVKIAQGLVPGNYYPGDIQFVVSGGKGYVIAHLYIEDYIYGVLPYEMDNGWPLEALKAQAVAARTYAIRAKTSGGLYDVSDTTQHQVFRGVNYNKTNCIRAVDETWGVVMKYGDEFISAYYSASNGGQTETNSNYWGGKQLPYLQMKDDPFDLENPNASVKSYMIYSKPSYGSSTSAYDMIAAAIAAKTGVAASQISITQINSVSFDTPKYAEPSRLYTNMTVKATYNKNKEITVSIPVFDTVKNGLNLKINNSQNELFSVVREDKGFRVYARRWGHGVGMSQRSAQVRARLGQSYDEILAFYYIDTKLGTFTDYASAPRIESDKYAVSAAAITGVAPGTIAEDMLKSLTCAGGTLSIMSAKGAETSGTIGTGCFVRISYEDGAKYCDIPIVIFGDTDGSGKIDTDDIVAIQKHMLHVKLLGGAYLAAADADHNGKIELGDIITLLRHINGDGKLKQEG